MAGKRSNGEGTLRKRPNGLWECTMMVGYKDDRARRYKSFYGKTQIICAAVRTPKQFVDCAVSGADIVTAGLAVFSVSV